MATEKLYELRYYQLAAQDVGKFRELASEHVPLRARRSRLMGFWGTELGAVNHVLHMWEYDSLNHRKTVRDDMSASAEWTNFLTRASPMLQAMDNWLCRPLLGDFHGVWSDKEFYKLTTVRYLQSESQSVARQRFLESIDAGSLTTGRGPTVVRAALETVIGNGREFSLLESTDDLQNLLTNNSLPGPFDHEANVSVQTKILNAYPWSRWIDRS